MKRKRLFIPILSILIVCVSFGFFYSLGDDHNTTAVQKDNSYTFTPPSSTNQKDLVGSWTQGAVVLQGRYAGRGVTWIDATNISWLYFLGGDMDGSGNGITRVDKYNINTNVWTNVASMPNTLANFSATRLKDSIYTVGGLVNTYFTSETAIVQKYDINANSWTTRASLPIVTGWPESVGYQDSLIYCLGGMISGGTTGTNAVWLYSCRTNTWRAATSLPTNRMGGACAMVGDTIVYVGGSNGWGGAVDHIVYRGVISQADRSSIAWNNTGLQYPGSNYWRFTAASWGCKGLITTGGAPSGFTIGTPETYVYSPGANTWTAQANLPVAMNTGNAGTVLFNSSSNIYKFVVASGLILSAPYSIPNTQIFTDTLPCAPPAPAYPWCEGFTSATFPPTGWTITGGTANAWLRSGTVSGYGLGTGAAYYNMWSALPGENEDFKTLTFSGTTNATDSVEFDYAYSPYPSSPPYSQDSLVILASTNGGTSWISLARMGPTDLQTAPASSSEFIPTASQWARKRLSVPLGTNKIDFLGESQFGNDLYIDSICVQHPTGIQPITNGIPRVYSLAQNYPNPFNPSTKISFALPKAGNVELKIYDILGREVTTLVNEFRIAGNYTVDFNAANLASGVYFYRIKSGDFIDTKKMVLMK